MNPSNSFNWKFVVAIGVLIAAVPTYAQKRRSVRHPAPAGPGVTVTITGTVLDAVTNAPVVNAEVHLGNRTGHTGTNGKFRVVTTIHGTAAITVSRSGYVAGSDSVSSDRDVTFRLQPTPTVRLRLTSGTQRDIDFESVEFGYVPAFGSYVKSATEDFCRPGGAAAEINRSQISRIVGPATSESHAACCPNNPVQKIRATLKSGETTTLYFADSCAGYGVDFIGRDHVSGSVMYFKFTDVAEIVFP
jgi:hypothetical protein